MFAGVVFLPAYSAGASSAIEPADGEHRASSTTTTQPGSEEESAGINQLPPLNTVVGEVLYALAVSVSGSFPSVGFGVYFNCKLAEQSMPRRQRLIRPLLEPFSKCTVRDIEQTRRIPLQPTANHRGRVSWLRRIVIWMLWPS